MRILFLTLWLLLPLGLIAWHYGPGQKHLALDHTEQALAQARAATARQDWPTAIEAYATALSKLPEGGQHQELAWSIRLESAKAELQNAGLIEAHTDLEELRAELEDHPGASAALKSDVLSTLANSRYYLTYLMKLEGKPPADWEPEIEAARQEYKHLAQSSADQTHLANLEATIRLARADPKDLYGLPIPNQ